MLRGSRSPYEWLKTQTWSAAVEGGWFYSSDCVLPRGTFVKSFVQRGWIKVRGWRPRFIGPSILKPSPLSVWGPNEFRRSADRNVCSRCIIYGRENCCLRFIFKMKFTYAPCQQLRPLNKTEAFEAKSLRATHTCVKKMEGVEKSKPHPSTPFVWKNYCREEKTRKQCRSISPWFRTSFYYSHTPLPNKSTPESALALIKALGRWAEFLSLPLYPTCHLSALIRQHRAKWIETLLERKFLVRLATRPPVIKLLSLNSRHGSFPTAHPSFFFLSKDPASKWRTHISLTSNQKGWSSHRHLSWSCHHVTAGQPRKFGRYFWISVII